MFALISFSSEYIELGAIYMRYMVVWDIALAM